MGYKYTQDQAPILTDKKKPIQDCELYCKMAIKKGILEGQSITKENDMLQFQEPQKYLILQPKYKNWLCVSMHIFHIWYKQLLYVCCVCASKVGNFILKVASFKNWKILNNFYFQDQASNFYCGKRFSGLNPKRKIMF